MKKKGFTLVELLAVIAILAILVIVAMPNVLGMFNQAKSSTFVTEVQTYMDAAKTKFISSSLGSTGEKVFYYNNDDQANAKNALEMDGAEKNYYIKLDTYGNFERVIVWDKNFCYDSWAAGYSTAGEYIDKSNVLVSDLKIAVNNDGVNTVSGSLNYDDSYVHCMGAIVETKEEYKCGDVNMDGNVDMDDVTKLSRKVGGISPEKLNEKAADINGDSAINSDDLTALASYVGETAGPEILKCK